MATDGAVGIERIVFEPAEDGKRWKMRLEGGDVEGHHSNCRFRAMEPSGEDEQTGEALYRLTLEMDGEDVEAHHSNFRFSRPEEPDRDDAEAHGYRMGGLGPEMPTALEVPPGKPRSVGGEDDHGKDGASLQE